MSAEFDPYQVWLSIPPSEQPANFYRLLGLPLFESNPDVISNAADRQMAFVRTFQTGKYSELSQKILNELSQARITLLDAQKKAQYDANLHGEQNVEQTANQSGSFGEIQSPPPPSADTLTPQQPSDASQSFWGNFNDASGSSASGSSNILTASTKNAEFSFSAPDSAAQKSDSSSFSSINTESGIHFKDHVTKTSSPKIKKKSAYKKVSPVKRKNNNTLMFAGIGGGVLFLLMIVIIFFSGSGEKASKRITDDDASLKRTYLEQANNYFTNHEYEKAVDAYQKASKLDPDDNYASDQISIIYRYYLNGETQTEFGKNKNNANVSSVVDSNRGASSNAYEGKRNRKKRVHTDAKEIEPPPTDELQPIYAPREWFESSSEETPQESKREASKNLAAGTRKTVVVNGVAFAFRWCPPGTFMMGSPESENGYLDYPDRNKNNEAQHEVTLTKGFWIMETEVTQKQWQAVMGYNPSQFKGDDCPVECVTWSDCQKFCFQLGFQLPTEAQWEYACRAGSSGAYAGNLNEMAWYGSNSGKKTHPVGMKKPNAWGLYDMHGNVWEWCHDWQLMPYPGGSATDPEGPSNGDYRVHRGGSWRHGESWCRSAYRSGRTPDAPVGFVGFRCICTKLPAQSDRL